jgi:peptidoglycan hydrolase-like protein with peptidoglycan-binding domain
MVDEWFSKGAANDSVRKVQTCLHNLGFYNFRVDGYDWTHTDLAIKRFQTYNGLLADGKVGELTWNVLHKNCSNIPIPAPSGVGSIQTRLRVVTGNMFTTFSGFFPEIYHHYNYGYYFNNQLNLQQEEEGKTPENCVDLAQLLHALGHEMGYEVRFIGIYCTGDRINHAFIQIRGKEFGNVWTDADGAAAAKNDYKLGSHWCNGAKTVNPSWIPNEDL